MTEEGFTKLALTGVEKQTGSERPVRANSSNISIQSIKGEKAEEKQKRGKYAYENNSDFRDICDHAKVYEDIPCDIWGAIFFTVVIDLPDLRSGRIQMEGKVRLAFIGVAGVMNLVIQFILLFFILSLIMLPGILSTQNVYAYFHQNCFTEGVLDQHRFDTMDPVEKNHLCGLALSHGLFVKIIIFLWVTTNIGELRDIYKKSVAVLFVLPRLPDGLETDLMTEDDIDTTELERELICLNWKGRVGLLVIVFIPKFLIAITLLFCGSVWLMSSQNFPDLILNSLALAFVTEIDELIANVFLPENFKEDLTRMRMKLPEDKDEKDPHDRSKKRAFEFMASSVLLIVAVLIVQAIVLFQPILPNYPDDVNGACARYLNQQVPWCKPWQKDCFPMS